MNSPGKYKSLDLQVVRDGSGVGAVMRGVEGFDFGDGGLEGAGLGHKEVFGDGGVAFGVGVEIEDGTVGFHVTITTRRDTVPAVNGQRGERQIVDPRQLVNWNQRRLTGCGQTDETSVLGVLDGIDGTDTVSPTDGVALANLLVSNKITLFKGKAVTGGLHISKRLQHTLGQGHDTGVQQVGATLSD